MEKATIFLCARALIMRKILHSKDAQCNKEETPYYTVENRVYIYSLYLSLVIGAPDIRS